MLTKQERAAIAERLKSTEYITSSTLFKALTGEEKLSETSHVKSLCIICSVILGLCDTSNMIELPLDKYGEVIRVGDTVYDKDGEEGKVGGYYYNNGTCKIIIPYGENGWNINFYPSEITHKKPVTIASINEQIKHLLDKGHMSAWSMAKLFDISEQLEKLGDSDD